MGDDGTMAKGTRYTPEFKAKAVRLLTESRGSYSSETKAIEQVAKDLGVAPETLRRWRSKTDATVAAETKQSAEDAMAELKSLRAEVARLRRANEILTTASAFSRHGSTRHGVDGRLHRRIQGPFQGRADPQGAGRFAGLRVHHAARLPHVQIQARQPHGRQARGAGPRHPRDPCRFLHGRVRVPQDARPVVGAGPGSGRDRPRPGDERHAGIGNPRRAPRQDARHHQTGEGHGRQARPRGTQVRGGGAEPAARGRHHLRAHGQRLVRPHGVRRRRVRPQDRRMGVRHHHGHQGAAAAGAGTGDIMGRLAWRHGRSRAPFRPWRAVHRPRVHHRGRGVRHASLGRHGRRLVRQRHGRERRRRVQDRARLATQALPGFEGPGIGDVPVGLVVGARSVCTGPWATGHRNGPKPSIMQTKRRKPSHYKGGTKIRPYQW